MQTCVLPDAIFRRQRLSDVYMHVMWSQLVPDAIFLQQSPLTVTVEYDAAKIHFSSAPLHHRFLLP